MTPPRFWTSSRRGRAIVVGYSMGGPVGLLLARRHPDRVAALVVQATALEWQRAARERAVWRMLPVMDLGLRLGIGAVFINRVLRRAAGEAPELDGYRPWLAAEFRRATARDLVGAGHALSRYDATPSADSWMSRQRCSSPPATGWSARLSSVN